MTVGAAGWPSGATRLSAVIGEPVRHSLSPVMFNAAFSQAGLDRVYVALEVPAGATRPALEGVRALGIDSVSVTMPHKSAAAEIVDDLSGDAATLAAVNCVIRSGDRLVGHNTDGAGFLASLREEAGLEPRGLKCVVLGAGGAARAVVLALARAGASRVTVCNRSSAAARAAVSLAGGAGAIAELGDVACIAGADLVVNATPVGMGSPPDGPGPTPVDPDFLPAGAVVVDLVYEPVVTPLLRAARNRGAVPIEGVGMLVHQAAVQFELLVGSPAPVEVMSGAARSALAARQASDRTSGGTGGVDR